MYCYGAHAIVIVNTGEYLCIETSAKVSSEPLSWKPPCEEDQGKAGTIRKLCGERSIDSVLMCIYVYI